MPMRVQCPQCKATKFYGITTYKDNEPETVFFCEACGKKLIALDMENRRVKK